MSLCRSYLFAIVLSALGCTSCATGAAVEPPPCDAATYAMISATCGDSLDECNAKLEEHEAMCAKRIKGVE